MSHIGSDIGTNIRFLFKF